MKVKLSEVLKNNEKSIYWLHNQTGISSATISRICNNKTTSIQFSVLDKICETLKCNVSDILVPEPSLKDKGDITD